MAVISCLLVAVLSETRPAHRMMRKYFLEMKEMNYVSVLDNKGIRFFRNSCLVSQVYLDKSIWFYLETFYLCRSSKHDQHDGKQLPLEHKDYMIFSSRKRKCQPVITEYDPLAQLYPYYAKSKNKPILLISTEIDEKVDAGVNDNGKRKLLGNEIEKPLWDRE